MLFIVLFALSYQVLANKNIVSLPISGKINLLKSGSTIVNRGKARHHVLSKRLGNIELRNMRTHYTVNVGIGSPPTFYDLVIDTGSSYVRGSVRGRDYKDLFTLSPSLSIPNVEFGVATSVEGIPVQIDGIFGLGRTTPGNNPITPNNGGATPKIMDTLLAQNMLQQNIFALSFSPVTSQGVVNGQLTLGGINPAKVIGHMNWVNMVDMVPGVKRWSFGLAIVYGGQWLQEALVGIVDSGESFIRIRPEAFQAYARSIPGSQIDDTTGLLKIPPGCLRSMQSMFFIIGGSRYEFTPGAQLWPRTLNRLLGTNDNESYFSVITTLRDSQNSIGNFILGYPFMQRFYTAGLPASLIGALPPFDQPPRLDPRHIMIAQPALRLLRASQALRHPSYSFSRFVSQTRAEPPRRRGRPKRATKLEVSGMMSLGFKDGPLVWIDLETTGLDAKQNRILEIAVLITNGNLDIVDEEGCHYIVKSTSQALKEMDEWCLNQHTKTGLVKASQESTHAPEEVAKSVLEYIKRWVPESRTGVLAGSSVHFDANFLRAIGPDVIENGGSQIWNIIPDHLHYRIVDVSTLKEICRRWYPSAMERWKRLSPRASNHRALDDIKHSIQELKFYREALFLKQPRHVNSIPK
ncbi:Polyporopepsin [Rhizoctonia solani]|uniref:Polyporopepsin n=1 Tax=Rhizoctonia solani TaxID=456999 RepID=A0A0K6G6E9_9AGAM|nr:Polyporopepsin [Rhizoctonia solani]